VQVGKQLDLLAPVAARRAGLARDGCEVVVLRRGRLRRGLADLRQELGQALHADLEVAAERQLVDVVLHLAAELPAQLVVERGAIPEEVGQGRAACCSARRAHKRVC
jgi:nucleoside-diphosphate-sugar epimerase